MTSRKSDRPARSSRPRLPVYLDGQLLEALAQTLDPSGVPGTRHVRTSEAGRTLEGEGYAVKATGRIGTRLLGGGLERGVSEKNEDERRADHTEEQEFVVREATLLWQAHSLLDEEGHLRVIDGSSIRDLEPGDWVELRTRSTGKSLLSLSSLLSRVLRLQTDQARERLDRLREGEELLRTSKTLPARTMIGELTLTEARQVFISDYIGSLAMALEPDELTSKAAIDGFAEELSTSAIADICAKFVAPDLEEWTAVLTVRTAEHRQIASEVLRDSEFEVFGKVTAVRQDGEPIRLVRRSMLDWMDLEDLTSMSSRLEEGMGGDSLLVMPPFVQVLPLALWV